MDPVGLSMLLQASEDIWTNIRYYMSRKFNGTSVGYNEVCKELGLLLRAYPPELISEANAMSLKKFQSYRELIKDSPATKRIKEMFEARDGRSRFMLSVDVVKSMLQQLSHIQGEKETHEPIKDILLHLVKAIYYFQKIHVEILIKAFSKLAAAEPALQVHLLEWNGPAPDRVQMFGDLDLRSFCFLERDDAPEGSSRYVVMLLTTRDDQAVARGIEDWNRLHEHNQLAFVNLIHWVVTYEGLTMSDLARDPLFVFLATSQADFWDARGNTSLRAAAEEALHGSRASIENLVHARPAPVNARPVSVHAMPAPVNAGPVEQEILVPLAMDVDGVSPLSPVSELASPKVVSEPIAPEILRYARILVEASERARAIAPPPKKAGTYADVARDMPWNITFSSGLSFPTELNEVKDAFQAELDDQEREHTRTVVGLQKEHARTVAGLRKEVARLKARNRILSKKASLERAHVARLERDLAAK